MAILKGILKDSLDYYLDLERRLKARLKELPQGSLFKRRIGRKDYYYLIFRDGKKVVSKYLGKEKPAQIEKDIRERRLIKKQIKEVSDSLSMINRLRKRKRIGRSVSKNS